LCFDRRAGAFRALHSIECGGHNPARETRSLAARKQHRNIGVLKGVGVPWNAKRRTGAGFKSDQQRIPVQETRHLTPKEFQSLSHALDNKGGKYFVQWRTGDAWEVAGVG